MTLVLSPGFSPELWDKKSKLWNKVEIVIIIIIITIMR